MNSHSLPLKARLRTADVFAALPDALLDRLAAIAHERRLEANAYLFHQGEKAQQYYVVMDGKVRLVQHTTDGKDVTLATFAAGDVIGLVVALSGDPYPGSAEVLEKAEVIALPGDALWPILNDHGPLAVRILRMTAARLHEAHERIRELSAERVTQRLARSLVRLARKVGVPESDPSGAIRLDMRLSRQDLAQMNGTTLETVSRTLSGWEREGLISAGREQITILKPHDLVVIAEDLAG